VHVAALEKAAHRAAEHRDAARAVGQLGSDDPALRLEALRQVRVGVERDAIGAQLAGKP